MKTPAKLIVAVAYNRDFEGADADPENLARADIRDIAENVAAILLRNGFDARPIGVTNDVAATVQTLRSLAPSAVFNLCESIHGDNRFEPLLPLLLDLHGLAYTGSGPLALSVALHKHKTKDVLRAHGVPTPHGVLLDSPPPTGLALRYPVIVKPAREDASVGITNASVVHDARALDAQVRHVLRQYRQPALVEEFIDGREIYVSLLQRIDGSAQILPFFEIDFSDLPADQPRIVSFEGKWVEDSVDCRGTVSMLCGALSSQIRAEISQTALRVFAAMELRDYARMDIRLTPDGVPYVIDVNPNCDLSDIAGGFAKAAKAAGLTYEDVILRLAHLALGRNQDAHTIAIAQRPRGARRAHRIDAGKSVSPGRSLVRDRTPRGGARSV